MVGIVDEAAPPFILLAVGGAIAAALLAYAGTAAKQGGLREKTNAWIMAYVVSSWVLIAVLLIRITTRATLGAGEGEAVLWGLDVPIIALTSFSLSAAPVLTVMTLRASPETETRPGRDPPE